MLIVESALKGYAIEASDGRIGTFSDALFEDTTWQLRWLVVDAGTWRTNRKLLIHPSSIGNTDHDRQCVVLTLTQAQIEQSPAILQDQPVSPQMESDLYGFYGLDPLWGRGTFGTGRMAAPLRPQPYGDSSVLARDHDDGTVLHDGEPHLRSMATIKGFHIHATDGEIGHIENVLIDDDDWGIRYFIVATRNWWPAQHVLISPYAVSSLSYPGRQVQLDISRAKVKAAPPWKPFDMIDAVYEKRLHKHYGWQGYGW